MRQSTRIVLVALVLPVVVCLVAIVVGIDRIEVAYNTGKVPIIDEAADDLDDHTMRQIEIGESLAVVIEALAADISFAETHDRQAVLTIVDDADSAISSTLSPGKIVLRAGKDRHTLPAKVKLVLPARYQRLEIACRAGSCQVDGGLSAESLQIHNDAATIAWSRAELTGKLITLRSDAGQVTLDATRLSTTQLDAKIHAGKLSLTIGELSFMDGASQPLKIENNAGAVKLVVVRGPQEFVVVSDVSIGRFVFNSPDQTISLTGGGKRQSPVDAPDWPRVEFAVSAGKSEVSWNLPREAH